MTDPRCESIADLYRRQKADEDFKRLLSKEDPSSSRRAAVKGFIAASAMPLVLALTQGLGNIHPAQEALTRQEILSNYIRVKGLAPDDASARRAASAVMEEMGRSVSPTTGRALQELTGSSGGMPFAEAQRVFGEAVAAYPKGKNPQHAIGLKPLAALKGPLKAALLPAALAGAVGAAGAYMATRSDQQRLKALLASAPGVEKTAAEKTAIFNVLRKAFGGGGGDLASTLTAQGMKKVTTAPVKETIGASGGSGSLNTAYVNSMLKQRGMADTATRQKAIQQRAAALDYSPGGRVDLGNKEGRIHGY